MIIGYEQSTVACSGIGSLLLAGRKGHDWAYVGSVGTGFNTKNAEYLRATLDKLKTKQPAVPTQGQEPDLCPADIDRGNEFRGWTDDGNCGTHHIRVCERSRTMPPSLT